MLERVRRRFCRLAPAVDRCVLRCVEEREQTLRVVRGIAQPVHTREDTGVMITVWDGGGTGYAATPDLSEAGLRDAIARAQEWAWLTRRHQVPALAPPPPIEGSAEHRTPVKRRWTSLTLAERLDLLARESTRLALHRHIVDWSVSLSHVVRESLLIGGEGGSIWQHHELMLPEMGVTASAGGESQTRTFGGYARARQGGLEVLEAVDFHHAAPRLAEEALSLLHAPQCSTETTALLLAPDQMVLQIHESIGHPLELDRILGDERNFAGTSFVTPEMFGHYRYGSPPLNITFDPLVPGELASYAYDDDGASAWREHIIRDGILLRPLGAGLSQARCGLPGVANARACDWTRPPIDRMANLNLEPGSASLGELVRQIERGLYMETNRSWSIDDSRNKFQFGCELGRLIVDGELAGLVKNPCYRGVSATFWRSLVGVGKDQQVLGVPNCGKGEPNQLLAVGHASPPCLFRDVQVFGGD